MNLKTINAIELLSRRSELKSIAFFEVNVINYIRIVSHVFPFILFVNSGHRKELNISQNIH